MPVVHLRAFYRTEAECKESGAQSTFLRDVTCPKCLANFDRQTLPARDRKPAQTLSVFEEGLLVGRQYAVLKAPQMRLNARLFELYEACHE